VGEGHTAALLQQIFEVDPLACPTGHGAMRIVACITQASVIDQILTHLRIRAEHATHAGARSPPSTRAPDAPRPRGTFGAREVDDHVTRRTRGRRSRCRLHE
jgi:hypothetical protein